MIQRVALYIAVYPSTVVRRCSIIKCIAFLPFYLASRPPISGRVALWITALCPRDSCIDAALSRPMSSFIELPPRHEKIFIHAHIYFLYFSISFFFSFVFCVSWWNIVKLSKRSHFIPIQRRRFINIRDVITIRISVMWFCNWCMTRILRHSLATPRRETTFW